jgi:hypothetical protein
MKAWLAPQKVRNKKIAVSDGNCDQTLGFCHYKEQKLTTAETSSLSVFTFFQREILRESFRERGYFVQDYPRL